MRERIATIGLVALVVVLVVLELATPCAGYIIDQPLCFIEARDQAAALFEEIGDQLGP